jgi:excisionase family DNA binding protein
MEQVMTGRGFLSVTETARLLGCSEKVVRAEIRRGRLPEYRVGRLVRIRVTDLELLRRTP